MQRSRIVKRSVVIGAHKTSVSLEFEFWSELIKIARQRHISITALVSEIDAQREHGNLSSCIRVYVLEQIKGLSK